jgi:hypothetical protein
LVNSSHLHLEESLHVPQSDLGAHQLVYMRSLHVAGPLALGFRILPDQDSKDFERWIEPELVCAVPAAAAGYTYTGL